MRMTAESEKVHGDVMREPHVVKPEPPAPSTGHAPRVSADAILKELAIIDQELADVRALIDGREATARELEQVASRIERVGRIAAQAQRWARTLATRQHVAMK